MQSPKKDCRILSENQLKKLKEHRYSCTNTGLLDPILQPFWNWLVEQLPLWLAPNLLTILGLIINILTSIVLMYYSPDCKQQVPRWACLLCALGLFVYQSLDAIDGKQARRTKSSSPLGELFDHGCDSLSTVFLTLNVAVSCQLGLAPTLTFFHCILGSFIFYCVHWRTYVTGTLHFGLVDVTEAEISMIIVQLISAFFGSEFWTREVMFSLTRGHLLILTTSPFEIFSLYQAFKIILGRSTQGGAGKNGSTVAGSSVISPAIPIFLALVPFVVIAMRSQENIYGKHPALFILTFGLIASKVTDRLIIAHMTKSEMKFFDRVLLGPAALLINQILQLGISETFLLWCSLLLAIFELYVYCQTVCREICQFLNIQLFRI